MLKRWLNGHLTQVLTIALGTILAAAAIGSWAMAIRIERALERMEQRDERYQARLEEHSHQIHRIRQRVRWLERNRDTSLTIWDMP